MKLHKSMTNRVLFGVCGGLAETFGIDARIIRIVFVLLHLLTRMPLFVIYLLLGFLLPYGTPDRQGRAEDEGFGAYEDARETGRNEYTPEAPPFDVSQAQDVEIDHHKTDYDER